MTTRESETLGQLIAERAGKRGSGLPTFEQLAERSIDPEGGYRPSPNLLWKITSGQAVKINPALVRAIAQGLELPYARVHAAATRQYIGDWHVSDPFDTDPGDDDEVIRVAHRDGLTAADMPRVREAMEESRRLDDDE